jgi:cell wall-associated NlpC family hydrolase
MLDLALHRAHLYLAPPDGSAVQLDPFLIGLNREHLRGELPRRVSAHLMNGSVSGVGDVLTACALGTRVVLHTTEDRDATAQWRFDGQIWTWRPNDTGDELEIVCYDDLILLDYQDQVTYPEGLTGAVVLQDVFERVGIPVGRIDGPAVPMPRIAWTQKLKDLVAGVLQQAVYRGDRSYTVHMESVDGGPSAVYVDLPSATAPVYWFTQWRNVFSVKQEQSQDGIANEALVIGTTPTKVDKKKPVISTQVVTSADDQDVTGRRRVIVKGSRFDSDAAAADAAAAELERSSEQNRVRGTTVALVSEVGKGALVRVQAGTLDGYFAVLGVSHDEDALRMDLTIGDRGTPEWQGKPLSEALAQSALGTGGGGPTVAALLAWCKAHVGVPYHWGGGHPGLIGAGWDCSGFVDNAYAAIGVTNFGWGGTGGILASGQLEQISGPEPGALVFFGVIPSQFGPTAHVGIVSEDTGRMYNALSPSAGTTVSSIAGVAAGRGVTGYYRVKGTQQKPPSKSKSKSKKATATA